MADSGGQVCPASPAWRGRWKGRRDFPRSCAAFGSLGSVGKGALVATKKGRRPRCRVSVNRRGLALEVTSSGRGLVDEPGKEQRNPREAYESPAGEQPMLASED